MSKIKLDIAYTTIRKMESEIIDLKEELETLQHWRNLALQFDNHRMSALWHLKALVGNPDHTNVATEFLTQPPLSAQDVVTKLYAAEQRNAELRELLCVASVHVPVNYPIRARITSALKVNEEVITK